MPKTKSTEIVAPESQNAGVDHSIHLHSSEQMEKVLNDSVHLTVTSPPYITTLFHEGQEFNYSGFSTTIARLLARFTASRFWVGATRSMWAIASATTTAPAQAEDVGPLLKAGCNGVHADSFGCAARGAGLRHVDRQLRGTKHDIDRSESLLPPPVP